MVKAAEKQVYSTHDVARLCHVTPMTVIRWVEEGKLRAFKTAGGHRRVMHDDLLAFMRARGLTPPARGSAAVLVVGVVESVRRERLVARLREANPDAEVHLCIGLFGAGRLFERVRPSVMFVDGRTALPAELLDARDGGTKVVVISTGEGARRDRGGDEVIAEDAPVSVLRRLLAD